MNRLLWRSSRRFFFQHPGQLVLALAGISLGIAVYVSVQLANDSARRAFELSTAALRAQTTHRLLPVGGPLDERIYRDLVVDNGWVRAAPIIEATAWLTTDAGERRPVTLRGVDPIKELDLRSNSGALPTPGTDLTRLLSEPATVLLPTSLAAGLSSPLSDDRSGDTSNNSSNDTAPIADRELSLFVGGQIRRVIVVGTVNTDGSDPSADASILTDISTAQELTNSVGTLSRIDLALTADQARRLDATKPAGTVLVTAASENAALQEMTRAFTTNLTALGLLALVVGMFLIYATMSFSIVQRRRTLAFLRAIGLGRRDLLASLLLEAAAMGIVGTVLGLMLGQLLANGLVDLVLRTMGDLYFRRAVDAAAPSGWIYVQGMTLGIVTTVVAALVPALEAARRDPARAESRHQLEVEAERLSRRAAWGSILVLITAGVLLLLDTASLWLAFAGLFLVLCAGAMLVPASTRLLMKIFERPLTRIGGLPATMAVRGVTASLSRTGVATAALAVAVATVMSIGLMISSFRTSLMDWLDTTLTADLYVNLDRDSDPANTAQAEIAALTQLPMVRGISLARVEQLPTAAGEIVLRAASPGPDGWGVELLTPSGADPSQLLAAEETVLVAEPFAYRTGLQAGAGLMLPTPQGSRRFTVGGIYRDYNTTGASALMPLDTYRRYWNDARVTGIGIHLIEGADSDEAIDAIEALFATGPPIQIRSTRLIERLALVVFDRTFQVTEVLRLLAAIVAFLGILSALLAIQLEREREFAVLRSIGMSAAELGRHILVQTGLLGLAAGLTAVPIGTALAWLLVYVINRRSFGWSMDLVLSWPLLVQGIGLALAAALLAGIYPALLGARTHLGAAWRDE